VNIERDIRENTYNMPRKAMPSVQKLDKPLADDVPLQVPMITISKKPASSSNSSRGNSSVKPVVQANKQKQAPSSQQQQQQRPKQVQTNNTNSHKRSRDTFEQQHAQKPKPTMQQRPGSGKAPSKLVNYDNFAEPEEEEEEDLFDYQNQENEDEYDHEDDFIDDTPFHTNPYMMDSSVTAFMKKIRAKGRGRGDQPDGDIEEASRDDMDREEARSRRLGIAEDKLEEQKDLERKQKRQRKVVD